MMVTMKTFLIYYTLVGIFLLNCMFFCIGCCNLEDTRYLYEYKNKKYRWDPNSNICLEDGVAKFGKQSSHWVLIGHETETSSDKSPVFLSILICRYKDNRWWLIEEKGVKRLFDAKKKTYSIPKDEVNLCKDSKTGESVDVEKMKSIYINIDYIKKIFPKIDLLVCDGISHSVPYFFYDYSFIRWNLGGENNIHKRKSKVHVYQSIMMDEIRWRTNEVLFESEDISEILNKGSNL